MENKHKQFNAFDKVLVRRLSISDNLTFWKADIFSHMEEDTFYVTIGSGHVTKDEILPYEGNEHLVGTDQEPEEEVELEEGELLVVSDYSVGFIVKMDAYNLQTFHHVNVDCFECRSGHIWRYAIRFKDFNPSNMEETIKHIFCVKNGKIIRYKG